MNARLLVGAFVVVLGIGALAYYMLKSSGETAPRLNVDTAGSPRVVPGVVSGTPKVASQATETGATLPAKADAGRIKPKLIDEVPGPPRELGLNGVVRTETGVEIEGAVCDLYEDSSSTAERAEEGELREKQVSNGNGLFLFDRNALASPDRFILKVSHPDYGTEWRPLDVTKAAPRVMVVTVKPGMTVSGTVRTTLGRPITSATVTVYDLSKASSDPIGAVETRGTTDGTGVYAIGNVTAGRKRIIASMYGYGTARAPDITIESGRPVESLGFVLNPGSAITGQVWTSDGTPIGGAWVLARPVGAFADAEAARNSGKPIEPPPKPFDPVVHPAVNPEEGEQDAKDPQDGSPAAPAPKLLPTTNLQPTSLAARTKQDGSYVIMGTEVGPYMLTVTASGFGKLPEQEVDGNGGNLIFRLERGPDADPKPPPPAKKK